MRKLLLILTMTYLKRLIFKNKLVIYIRTFVKHYNQKNCSQIYEIYGIIKLRKMCILIAENLQNLDTH